MRCPRWDCSLVLLWSHSSLGPDMSSASGNLVCAAAVTIAGERLELLKEVLPRLVRLAVLWNAANPYPAIVFKETQTAATRFGIEVQ